MSYNKNIINFIIDNGIPYCLVYASLSSREEYAQRMRERGNSEEFIKKMTDESEWKEFFQKNREDSKPIFKIELEKGQYLSDIADRF